jgi:predicted amidophosphoribosyltransferase
MPPKHSETRECPFCKEEVKATAIRCRHCQAALVPTKPDHGGICSFCKEEINVEAITCKHCGADLLTRGIIIHAVPNPYATPDPSGFIPL